MRTTAWFQDRGVGDAALAGAKGGNLGALTAAGLPVPPGFVVTSEVHLAAIEASDAREKPRATILGLQRCAGRRPPTGRRWATHSYSCGSPRSRSTRTSSTRSSARATAPNRESCCQALPRTPGTHCATPPHLETARRPDLPRQEA